jgi:TonB-linked SusC/RagA family outer membrane protein
MQKLNKQSFLTGLLLFSVLVAGRAQTDQLKSDSTGIEAKKTFLDQNTISLYGKSVSKRVSTTSISVIEGSEVRSMNTPVLGNALAGKLTGLSVELGSGSPGTENPWVQIRGIQTFLSGAGGIVVLVDGFETNWSSLHPDEIESVQVLKDAASLALYGNAGANGILYIKTKRGQNTEGTRITFNSRQSLQQPTVLPKFSTNGEYAEMYNLAMVSDGKDIATGRFPSQDIVDYYKNGTYPVLYPEVDWYNEILKPSSISQDYTLALDGKTENANYYVMLGYAGYPGLYANTDGDNNSNWKNNRYMSRINLDVNITDWLRASLNTRGTIITTKQPNVGESTIWRSMGSFLPFAVKTPSGEWGGSEGSRTNPVAQILQQGYNIEFSRYLDTDLKLVADIPVINGLSAFAHVAFSDYYFWDYVKTRGLSYQEIFPRTDTVGLYTTQIKGNTDKNFAYSQPSGTQWNRNNWITGLEFNRTFGKSGVHLSTMYSRSLYTTTFAASNVPYARINLMGRANYNYDGKYIGEFGYSYSGSDNYAPGKRFGFFPSISGAWVISKESFFPASGAVDFLKIRASYGMVGNNNIGSLERFPYFEYYTSPNGSYRTGNNLGTNQTTYEIAAYPNENSSWEKAYKTNIGVDAQLFSKLSLSADYFSENREGILVNPSNFISMTIGSRFDYLNMGIAKNHGFELEMTYSDRTSVMSYYVTPRVSFVKSEIVDAREAPKQYDYLYQRGNPISQPFVLEAIGFFADQADIDASPFQTFGTVKPGDVKYKDQNDDDFIDNNDLVPVGNPTLPNLIYSFDLGLNYKGFDLAVFLYGVSGRTISLLNTQSMVPFLSDVKPNQWIMDNYWTSTRGDAAEYPRLTTESNDNNYRASTLWQRDGSFLRIRNVELGYTVPVQSDINLRVYLNGVNLFTFDKIDEVDVDPEVLSVYQYPMMKSYNLGIKLEF